MLSLGIVSSKTSFPVEIRGRKIWKEISNFVFVVLVYVASVPPQLGSQGRGEGHFTLRNKLLAVLNGSVPIKGLMDRVETSFISVFILLSVSLSKQGPWEMRAWTGVKMHYRHWKNTSGWFIHSFIDFTILGPVSHFGGRKTVKKKMFSICMEFILWWRRWTIYKPANK